METHGKGMGPPSQPSLTSAAMVLDCGIIAGPLILKTFPSELLKASIFLEEEEEQEEEAEENMVERWRGWGSVDLEEEGSRGFSLLNEGQSSTCPKRIKRFSLPTGQHITAERCSSGVGRLLQGSAVLASSRNA